MQDEFRTKDKPALIALTVRLCLKQRFLLLFDLVPLGGIAVERRDFDRERRALGTH